MTVATSQADLAPLYLFADSQLLFWKRNGKLLLESVRESLAGDAPPAAYIGASNGDRPEFYEIFTAAMNAAGFPEHRMIGSAFTAEDREFLDRAQLILLAGGDVRLGWTTFEKTGMKEQILARYASGAVLVEASASPAESEPVHAASAAQTQTRTASASHGRERRTGRRPAGRAKNT